MKLTVYRQASKTRDDGTIVYKGEDARPYIDDNIFFVADGLGGASAIRHQSIVPELFESDKLLDALFKGVYEDYSDEKFVKYVTDSFFELFAVKDCYTKNIYNIKKSGYFGSRIVTAIVLHEIIYDEKVAPAKLFEQYDALNSDKEKEDFLNKLGDYFAQKIKEDIQKIAKNANLFYESNITGLALLGTTLCATIYRETEDGVEAIYLTAGDSRPYVWTEEEGFGQIIEDQEGKDGGMTNYIKANEDATFDIRCNYMQFKKPFVLFNASDGCFDSKYFDQSQMAFEKLILEKAAESNNTDEMGKALEETFLTYGTHDDSSTIAMKFFGYDSFEAFKESAAKRLKSINENYISKMPDLLDVNYVQEYEERSAKFKPFLSDIKTKFEAEEVVMMFSVEQMKNAKYSPYEKKIEEINKQIAEQQKQKNQALDQIKGIVSSNFIRFIELTVRQDEWVKEFIRILKDPVYRLQSKILKIEKKYKKHAENHRNVITRYQADFDKAIQTLKSEIDRIIEIGVPSDINSYDGMDIAVIKECNGFISSLNKYFIELKSQSNYTVRQLTKLEDEYKTSNRKLALNNQDKFQEICNNIVSGDSLKDIYESLLFEDDEKLKKCCSSYTEAQNTINSLNNEEKNKAKVEFGKQYWESNYKDIIEGIISEPVNGISEELLNEAKEVITELNEKTKEFKEKADMQTALFKQYDQIYNRYLGE